MIPKRVRDAAGLRAGSEVEVAYRDGLIEIEPLAAAVEVAEDGTIRADEDIAPLTAAEVRDVLEQTRR